jgi:uncharacterized protein DUF4328
MNRASDFESMSLRPLYFSTRRLSRVLGLLFVLVAAFAWAAAGYDYGELRVMHSGTHLDPVGVLRHAEAGRWIAVAQIASALLLAAVFVPWLHQARANLRALGARRLRFGREWTYLGFVIPILNAYRPYQVVSEVWRGSDPESVDPLGWQRLHTSRLVIAWWAPFALWVSLELVAATLLRFAPGIAHVQIAHALAFAGDCAAAVSASLGYFLVARIAAAQDAKWVAFAGGEPAAHEAAAVRVCGSVLA